MVEERQNEVKMLLMPRKRRVVESREREKVTKAYMKQIIY